MESVCSRYTGQYASGEEDAIMRICEKYTGQNASSGRDAAERVAGKYGGGYGSPREPWAAIIAPIL